MVAKAHGGESWFEKTALQTDLKVEMADKVVLQGRLLFETFRVRPTTGSRPPELTSASPSVLFSLRAS